MKQRFLICIIVVLILFSFAACGNQKKISLLTETNTITETTKEESDTANNTDTLNTETMIYAYINNKKLKILPANNSSANEFIDLLSKGDLVIDMHDYANFEKVGSLGTTLSSNDERITTKAGDVILYQGSSVTIYYDTNTWTFTRLGKIQDLTAEELKNILGDGNITVTFSLH